MEWIATASLPGYEINRSGDVRNARTRRPVQGQLTEGKTPFVQGTCQNKKSRAFVNVLLEEAFGPGAAAAAGYPTPSAIREQPGQNGGRAKPRRCHDCGKPTHNYRCDACWRKRRGFAQAAMEDG